MLTGFFLVNLKNKHCFSFKCFRNGVYKDKNDEISYVRVIALIAANLSSGPSFDRQHRKTQLTELPLH